MDRFKIDIKKRRRADMVMYVARLRYRGFDEDSVVRSLESFLEENEKFKGYFESVHDIADVVEVPVSKFSIDW